MPIAFKSPPHGLVSVNKLNHSNSKSTQGRPPLFRCSRRRTSEFRAHRAHCSSLCSKHLLIGSVFVFQSDLRPTLFSQPEGGGGGLSFLLIYDFTFNDIALFIAVTETKNLGIFCFLSSLREPVHSPCVFVVHPSLFQFHSLTIRVLSTRQTKC